MPILADTPYKKLFRNAHGVSVLAQKSSFRFASIQECFRRPDWTDQNETPLALAATAFTCRLSYRWSFRWRPLPFFRKDTLRITYGYTWRLLSFQCPSPCISETGSS